MIPPVGGPSQLTEMLVMTADLCDGTRWSPDVSSLKSATGSAGLPDLAPLWVRLSTNGINMWIFKNSIQHILALQSQNVLNTYIKNSQISPIWCQPSPIEDKSASPECDYAEPTLDSRPTATPCHTGATLDLECLHPWDVKFGIQIGSDWPQQG